MGVKQARMCCTDGGQETEEEIYIRRIQIV